MTPSLIGNPTSWQLNVSEYSLAEYAEIHATLYLPLASLTDPRDNLDHYEGKDGMVAQDSRSTALCCAIVILVRDVNDDTYYYVNKWIK